MFAPEGSAAEGSVTGAAEPAVAAAEQAKAGAAGAAISADVPATAAIAINKDVEIFTMNPFWAGGDEVGS